VSNGKTFRRAIEHVPPTDPMQLCIRVPARGRYALSVVHDRAAAARSASAGMASALPAIRTSECPSHGPPPQRSRPARASQRPPSL
jgi:hypothetical protein